MSKRIFPLAVLLLWSSWQAPSQAQESSLPRQNMGNLVPGRTMQAVPVRSVRALRFKDLVQQQQDFTCGAAALATLLQHVYGRPVREEEVIAEMLRNTDPKQAMQRGFSLLDMKNYVERIGLRGRGYTVDRASLRAVKIPVIALQDHEGYKHFVIVKKVVGNTVFLADPALGHRQMSLDDFAAGWNNIVFAVVGDGIRPDNALIASAQPLAPSQRAGIVTQTLPQQRQYGLLGIDTF